VDDGEHTRGRDRIDLTLDAGLVTSVVADGAFRTDRGVTQNSTFSEVAAAYGGASNLESPSLDQAAGRWVVSDRDGRTIHFFHVAGAASSIVMVGVYDQTTTGLFPLEPYYCATNLSR
jgi:hypothetical protein